VQHDINHQLIHANYTLHIFTFRYYDINML